MDEGAETVSNEEFSELRDRINDVTSRIDALEALTQARESEISQIRDVLTALKSTLTQDVKNLGASFDELTSRIDFVSSSASALERALLTFLTTRLRKDLSVAAEGLRKELSVAAGKIEENREAIDTVGAELKKTTKNLSAEITGARKDLSATFDRELKRTTKDLSARMTDVRKELFAADEEIRGGLAEALARIKENRGAIEATGEELKNTSGGLSARIADALVKIEDNRGSVNSLSKEVKKTTEELTTTFNSELKKVMKNLSARIGDVRRDLSASFEEVRGGLEDALAKIEETRESFDKLSEDLYGTTANVQEDCPRQLRELRGT